MSKGHSHYEVRGNKWPCHQSAMVLRFAPMLLLPRLLHDTHNLSSPPQNQLPIHFPIPTLCSSSIWVACLVATSCKPYSFQNPYNPWLELSFLMLPHAWANMVKDFHGSMVFSPLLHCGVGC
eukprot:Gb_20233 [translate_table: standard]